MARRSDSDVDMILSLIVQMMFADDRPEEPEEAPPEEPEDP
ncbi:MAG: hypothetical protein P8R42_28400 [Candidatus Binatia bacterium]|nr:hypothetical protein [Candidatus Binatia bacterium]